MAETCPHCGAALPTTSDAFCPECRNDLDDVASPKLPPQNGKATRGAVSEAFHIWHATKFGMVAVTLVVGAILAAIDGEPSFAIGLILAAVAVGLLEAIRRSIRGTKRPRDEMGFPEEINSN